MSNPIDQLRNNHSDFSKNTDPIDFLDPWDGFHAWFNTAASSGEKEANAMVLSTCNEHGAPSARIVYLKEVIRSSFVFYTNYTSRKGNELAKNPKASLLFFWPGLERQIRIEGEVTAIAPEESDAYFASRPRESQIGAWASHQSEELRSAEDIQKRVAELELRFPTQVPRPPHWGGYALSPTWFEFWQGKPSRLHERLVFELKDAQWRKFRLNP